MKKCLVFSFLMLSFAGLMAKNPSISMSEKVHKDIQPDAVLFFVDADVQNYTITLKGPSGIETREFTGNAEALIEVIDDEGRLRPDGLYKYEMTFAPKLTDAQRATLKMLRNNPGLRDDEVLNKATQLPRPMEKVTGTFRIDKGLMVVPENETELMIHNALVAEANAKSGGYMDSGRDGSVDPGDGYDTGDGGTVDSGASDQDVPTRDQVIGDDLIVTQSACIGTDCANGENFGFDTLRLKENNLRIKFQDTSNSGSFPSNDWQLTANDSTNGGANKFSIDDIDGGRTPFTIEASAPTHSLYVDDGGRVGLGTSTPVVELHIKDGDTPTLRLEQDNSSGFNAQTWDVAGNETNFFVRDVSNGSRLPFKVFPNAPTNSLIIEGSTGDIGVGTTSPSASIHVVRNDGAQVFVEDSSATQGPRTLFKIKNKGNPEFEMENTGNSKTWKFSAGQNFVIKNSSDTNIFQVSDTGDITIPGSLTANGSVFPDYVFAPNYKLLPLDEVEKFIAENGHLPNVPNAEHIEKHGVNMTDMQKKLMEKVEELTLYTIKQQNEIEALRRELKTMTSK